jgi:phage terminase large subunit
VIERMAQTFDCEIVPRTNLQDRINAARMVIPRCSFHIERCARGLEALRAWAFKFDEERKDFSREPDHNWASHGSDAFSYGAQILREEVMDGDDDDAPRVPLVGPANYAFTLEDLYTMRERRSERW